VLFAHERLAVYQKSIEFVAWSHLMIESLPTGGPLRSQLERASASIPLNIAEGNAKSSSKDRARYWQIALGSTFECAAILDVLVARRIGSPDGVYNGKEMLSEITAMLMAMLKSLGRKVAERS
jgi:four helix bundle protein